MVKTIDISVAAIASKFHRQAKLQIDLVVDLVVLGDKNPKQYGKAALFSPLGECDGFGGSTFQS
jgi:hypothetical protein